MERARGATWLDKRLVELGGDGSEGKAVQTSLMKRQSQLRTMGLEFGGDGRLLPSALETLREMDLREASGDFQKTFGKPYAPLGDTRNVEGVYRQSIQRPSGKFAVI